MEYIVFSKADSKKPKETKCRQPSLWNRFSKEQKGRMYLGKNMQICTHKRTLNLQPTWN